jgi:hypothetical protein
MRNKSKFGRENKREKTRDLGINGRKIPKEHSEKYGVDC